VSIQEQDPADISTTKTAQEKEFLQGLSSRPEGYLAKPFGSLNYPMMAALAVLSAGAIICYSHIINLGKVGLNWDIRFDVNLVATLIVLVLGGFSVIPKVVRNIRALREQTTIASIVVLVVVAAFFILEVADFGTFQLKINELDISLLIGTLFIAGIGVFGVFGSKTALGVLGIFFLWWGFNIINAADGKSGFGVNTVIDLFTSERGGRIINAMFPPNWTIFKLLIDPMLLTIQTAVSATMIGILVSLPLSILAARNTTPHPIIYNVIRLIINTTRAIPSLIWALLLVPFVGLGPGAGILGLAIHSVSVLTKLYAESFESVKPQPLEALNAVGANGLKTFRWGVFPQAWPLVASYSIFNWESNGRDSTVVAFVGGGGIGLLLQAYMSLLDYANVAVILIVLILTVTILDRFSDFVRSKII
jgi:phosphonate transport system permease protein